MGTRMRLQTGSRGEKHCCDAIILMIQGILKRSIPMRICHPHLRTVRKQKLNCGKLVRGDGCEQR